MRKKTALDAVRHFTRLELRHADEIKDAVQSYSRGHSVEEVAKALSMSKTLVQKLNRDDAGTLLDAILWMRKKESENGGER